MTAEVVESNVPARLDRLPWTRWHWTMVIALGITWLLDGLETTMGGGFVGVLKNPRALGLTDFLSTIVSHTVMRPMRSRC